MKQKFLLFTVFLFAVASMNGQMLQRANNVQVLQQTDAQMVQHSDAATMRLMQAAELQTMPVQEFTKAVEQSVKIPYIRLDRAGLKTELEIFENVQRSQEIAKGFPAHAPVAHQSVEPFMDYTAILWPPRNFVATRTAVGDVALEWNAPTSIVGYDMLDGEDELEFGHHNFTGPLQVPGLSGNISIAHRFTPEQLIDMQVAGAELTEIWFIRRNSQAATGQFRVRIGIGGSATDPGVIVYERGWFNIPASAGAGWVGVGLNSPVDIPFGQEMWIIIDFNVTVANQSFVLSDTGPAVQGHGNMIFWNGNWIQLQNVQSPATDTWLWNWVIDAVAELPNGTTVTTSGSPLGYRVWRGNTLLTPDVTTLSHIDIGATAGEHIYTIRAVYEDGLSQAVLLPVVVEAANELNILTLPFPHTQQPVSQPTTPVALAVNTGTATQTDVTLSATLNGDTVSTSAPHASLAPGAFEVLPAPAFNPVLGANSLVYTVSSSEGATASAAPFNFVGTENVFATDLATTASGTVTLPATWTVGSLFEVTAATNILQAVIGFGAGEATEYVIALFEAGFIQNELATAPAPIFVQTQTRPATAGFVTVDVPVTELSTGMYFLAIQSAVNVGLLHDNNPNNFTYVRVFAEGAYWLDRITLEGGAGTAVAVRMIIGDVYDAAITAITSPTSGTNLSNSETVTATIQNNGTSAITDFNVILTVNGVEIATETFSDTIAAGGSANHTFTATADLSAEGDHTVMVTVVLANDEVAENDSHAITVTNAIPVTVVSLSPADGAINVALDASVKVTFSGDITAGDLNGITFSPNVNGVSASVAGDVLAINHADFAENTEYTITIPAGTIVGFNEVITWSFTTEETTTNVQTNKLENLIIYPNPVSDRLFIESPTRVKRVEIYNLLGSLVRLAENDVHQVFVGDITSGVYLIRIVTEQGTVTQRFVKE